MIQLKETHTFKDFLYWNLFALIPLSLAVAAIGSDSWAWVVVYVLIYAGHFLILEYRYFCTHCPHYCNGTSSTRCMFLWGVPKFYKKKPGPLTGKELALMGIGFTLAIFFPVFWLAGALHLAFPYFLSWLVLLMTVNRYECGRCIFFDCPANAVPAQDREAFLNRSRSFSEGAFSEGAGSERSGSEKPEPEQ